MPEGQFTGRRGVFLYTSDSGEVFAIRTDATLGGLAGTGLTAATTGNIGNASPKPAGFKLRGVHWQGELGDRIVRKFLVCNTNGTLYSSGISQALTIDGVVGATTGKRGEQVSFVRLPAADGNP